VPAVGAHLCLCVWVGGWCWWGGGGSRRRGQEEHDPRRLQWLTKPLMAMRLDPSQSAAFSEARTLALQASVLGNVDWRRPDWAREARAALTPVYAVCVFYWAHPPMMALQVLVRSEAALAHPYKQVRDELGTMLVHALQILCHPALSDQSAASFIAPAPSPLFDAFVARLVVTLGKSKDRT
jgi:hypothetical protein